MTIGKCSTDAQGVAGDMANARDWRQRRVVDWVAAAFGVEQQTSVPQRGIRLLEEAIEAYQACGCDADMAHKMVDYVFAREPGNLRQEMGGVGMCLLALGGAAGVSADLAEAQEMARVLSKPLSWFAARNRVKNEAGFEAPSPEITND